MYSVAVLKMLLAKWHSLFSKGVGAKEEKEKLLDHDGHFSQSWHLEVGKYCLPVKQNQEGIKLVDSKAVLALCGFC